MTIYIDDRGVEWESAELALDDFLSDLPDLMDEDVESVFQFTHYQATAADNLKAIEYGIVYAGCSTAFVGYPIPHPKEDQ